MRELVRGENRRTIDGTLIRIGEAVTSGLAHPRPLRDHRRASRQFSAEAGCGKGMEAISVEGWALLDRVKMRRPRRPEDYGWVLAGIHRRAQQSRHPGRQVISEGCVTAYLPPIGAHFRRVPAFQRMRAIQVGQPLSDEEANRLHDEALPGAPSSPHGLDRLDR
jgi:hypothetical protein